jgi:PIN domain nuclease of toxin-antitoxin system
MSIAVKSVRRKLELSLPYSDFVDKLLSVPTLIEEPITSSIIKRSHELNFHADPFDILIVATALEKELPLITNDSVIHSHEPCQLCWD